jgi:menaquinone-dependent protoporphyrinogen IX oxidase
MTQNKTLVAFETKSGATEEYTRRIAEVLGSKFQLEVDLVNLKKQDAKDWSQYQNIVIGGGVRADKVYGKAMSAR